MSVRIGQRLTGPLQVWTYLVQCPRTQQAVLIDPGGQEQMLADWVQEEGAQVQLILNTHGHGDHVAGNAVLSERLGVACALHHRDIDHFDLQSRFPVRPLESGERLRVGDLEIAVLHTPGHTPGGVCYLVEGNVFTGDTLFVGAVGRTDLEGSSLEQLLQSIEEQLLTLPPETVVWPGHDYGEASRSTIGEERRENPYITDLIYSHS